MCKAGLLPCVHVGVSLPDGDWVMAGFDLTMLVSGLVMAWIAHTLQKQYRNPGIADSSQSSMPAQSGTVGKEYELGS